MNIFSSLLDFWSGLRFGRFPIWEHKGWQVIGFFGELPSPEVHPMLQLGWRTALLGVIKIREDNPPKEGAEILSENIHGFLFQGQIWLPFARIGKI